MQFCESILQSNVGYIVVEGAGGWLVPLNVTETLADFAKALNFPVILVVGIKLGCLNDALLTYQHMQNSNIEIAGWIANQINPEMLYFEENIAMLKKRLAAPLLEVTPYKHK